MGTPLNDQAMDQLFRAARTVNAYTDAPVPTEMLHQVWDLMKWGPTSVNCLPARITWCVSQDAKDKLAALSGDGNKAKIQAAPVTAIIGMDMAFYNELPELFPAMDTKPWFEGNPAMSEPTAFRNSSLQGGYLILAARALGLDVGPMSGFDNAAVDEAFFAGTTIKSNFIATMGYGVLESAYPRAPRPAFDRFNQIA
jgi:3-hydroxypropanoate dehydrogenase